MAGEIATFRVKLAETEAEIAAAQRLRYRVFVEEMGGGGALVDHDARLERDALDPFCDHLLLQDLTRPPGDAVVGVYRLLRAEQASRAGGFYSEGEYDIAPLLGSGRRLLELGRSCLLPECRGGMAMHKLWNALAGFVAQHEIEVLFGTASFAGTDLTALAQPLSLLHHRHLAPPELRARSRVFQPMDLVPPETIDRRLAMLATPPLIKAYLRLGGVVGEGAFVDHDFNTTDVLLILDTQSMNPRQAGLYTRARV